MSVATVREYLKGYGLEDRVMEFETSSATVELAAQAVGCEPAMIAKTLSFLVDEGCVLIVAAGDARIDNTKYKAKFHTKAKMLTPEQVIEMTGHSIGGVCPFVTGNKVRTYLDISLKRFEIIYPAAGSASSAVKLGCEELYRASKAIEWIDVCKGWESLEG